MISIMYTQKHSLEQKLNLYCGLMAIDDFIAFYAGRPDSCVDELHLQVPAWDIQADHAALSQALVVRSRIRHPVPRLSTFARFTCFESGFVWHYSGGRHDAAFLHKSPSPCNTPIRTKPRKGASK